MKAAAMPYDDGPSIHPYDTASDLLTGPSKSEQCVEVTNSTLIMTEVRAWTNKLHNYCTLLAP